MSVSPPTSSSITVQLRIRDQTGDEMFFRTTRSTLLEKFFGAYAGRRGLLRASLRFMLEGQNIVGDFHTANTLQLEDNDQIDVMLQTTGD